MFSGIIADIGTISSVQERSGGLRIAVTVRTLDLDDVQIGDSIAVSGVCLTVVEKSTDTFTVDVSRETLVCTVGLGVAGARVNLEKALRLSDRLGGHLVSGHVDGTGTVLSFVDLEESWTLTVRAPAALARYIAAKGSITIDGVSLTVNEVGGEVFSVNLIPHTLLMTTLHGLHTGAQVNLEIDMFARYVERLLATSGTMQKSA